MGCRASGLPVPGSQTGDEDGARRGPKGDFRPGQRRVGTGFPREVTAELSQRDRVSSVKIGVGTFMIGLRRDVTSKLSPGGGELSPNYLVFLRGRNLVGLWLPDLLGSA